MKRKILIIALVFIISVSFGYKKDISNPLPIKYALRNDGCTMNLYEFQIDGLPKECSVTIETINMVGQITATFSGKLNKENYVVDDIIGINKLPIYFDSGYGECMGVTICESWAPFSTKIGALSIVPHPLEISDEYGHWIKMVVRKKEGTEFNSLLSGFEPNENVELKLTAGDHSIKWSISVNEKGEHNFRFSPVVKGSLEGPFILTAKNKTTEISLQHYWGEIAFTPPSKYLQLKDKFPEFFNENMQTTEPQKTIEQKI